MVMDIVNNLEVGDIVKVKCFNQEAKVVRVTKVNFGMSDSFKHFNGRAKKYNSPTVTFYTKHIEDIEVLLEEEFKTATASSNTK